MPVGTYEGEGVLYDDNGTGSNEYEWSWEVTSRGIYDGGGTYETGPTYESVQEIAGTAHLLGASSVSASAGLLKGSSSALAGLATIIAESSRLHTEDGAATLAGIANLVAAGVANHLETSPASLTGLTTVLAVGGKLIYVESGEVRIVSLTEVTAHGNYTANSRARITPEGFITDVPSIGTRTGSGVLETNKVTED